MSDRGGMGLSETSGPCGPNPEKPPRAVEERELSQPTSYGVGSEAPLGQSEPSVKDEVNLALDQLESAGHALVEAVGYSRLTERLGEILADLEQWKADVWEALDA